MADVVASAWQLWVIGGVKEWALLVLLATAWSSWFVFCSRVIRALPEHQELIMSAFDTELVKLPPSLVVGVSSLAIALLIIAPIIDP